MILSIRRMSKTTKRKKTNRKSKARKTPRDNKSKLSNLKKMLKKTVWCRSRSHLMSKAGSSTKMTKIITANKIRMKMRSPISPRTWMNRNRVQNDIVKNNAEIILIWCSPNKFTQSSTGSLLRRPLPWSYSSYKPLWRGRTRWSTSSFPASWNPSLILMLIASHARNRN